VVVCDFCLQVILQPPLPSVEELLADEAAAVGDKAKKGSKPAAAAAAKKPAGKDAKGGKGEQALVQHCLQGSSLWRTSVLYGYISTMQMLTRQSCSAYIPLSICRL
jgi:hypothetical protein